MACGDLGTNVLYTYDESQPDRVVLVSAVYSGGYRDIQWGFNPVNHLYNVPHSACKYQGTWGCEGEGCPDPVPGHTQ